MSRVCIVESFAPPLLKNAPPKMTLHPLISKGGAFVLKLGLVSNKTTVFVLKTVVFLTFLVNPLGGLGQFKSFQKRKHMLRKMAAEVHLFCEDLYGGAGS